MIKRNEFTAAASSDIDCYPQSLRESLYGFTSLWNSKIQIFELRIQIFELEFVII